MQVNINRYIDKIISRFRKIRISGNGLKIIAIVTMLIDHIGYYFQENMPSIIYVILRIIGRISMPLFAYLIVQGFFYTKDLKKYITRVFSLALITQVAIFVVSIFDATPERLSVNVQLNILFSYTLSLITLWVIHEKNIIQKFTYNQNLFLKVFMILTIIGIYVFIPIDYGIYVPLLIVMLYFIEKLKVTIYLEKNNYNMSMKKVITSFISERNIKIGYIALILIALLIIIIESKNSMYWYMLLSIIPISLYNGERGIKSKKIRWAFYSVFPIQHFLLYLLSVII